MQIKLFNLNNFVWPGIGSKIKKWVKTIDKGLLMLYFCTKLQRYALVYTAILRLETKFEIWQKKKRKLKPSRTRLTAKSAIR